MYTFFMVAESFSFIALLIIVITVVFSRKVVRSPTWIHFCITCESLSSIAVHISSQTLYRGYVDVLFPPSAI
jgi:hypothetical protein